MKRANNISTLIISILYIELHIIILNIKLAINNTAVTALSTWIRGVIKSLRGKKPRRYKSNSGRLTYCHTFLDSRWIAWGGHITLHHSVILSYCITGTYGTTCIPVIPVLAVYFIASLYSVVVVLYYTILLFGSRKKSRTRTSSITLTNASSITLIQVLL